MKDKEIKQRLGDVREGDRERERETGKKKKSKQNKIYVNSSIIK